MVLWALSRKLYVKWLMLTKVHYAELKYSHVIDNRGIRFIERYMSSTIL